MGSLTSRIPARLGAADRAAQALAPVLGVEGRRRARVAILVLDAQREHADLVERAALAQHAQPPQRQQASVELGQHLVHVGQRERGAHDVAVPFGDEREALVEDRLELLRVRRQLGVGQRHEAPVVFPRRVVNLHQAAHLGLAITLVTSPAAEARLRD